MLPDHASTISLLRIAWRHLPAGRRRSIVLLLVLVLASGFAELVSIGAILPFLTLLAQFEGDAVPQWLRPWSDRFGLTSRGDVIIAATAVLALTAILAATVRLQLARISQKFVFGAAYDLGVRVFDKALRQPYPYHVARNSSDIVADINKAQILAPGLFLPVVQATGAAFIAFVIVVGLLVIDTTVALAAGAGFALIYGMVIFKSRAMLRRNSIIIAEAWAKRLKAANEALGGIRDITLDRTYDVFVERFRTVERALSSAQFQSSYRSAAPRFVVEGAGIVLLAVIAAVLTLSDRGFAGALPVLGVLALGAQRLLPLVQSIYAGWVAASASQEMLRDLVATLELPDPPAQRTENPWPHAGLRAGIAFQDVDFAYPGTTGTVIKDANFRIGPGDRIGIVGTSGSGKTTLMDLLLGLHLPTDGTIAIDQVALDTANLGAWRGKVAHVPQHIFLSDTTIGENIAFGTPRESIDWERVTDAAKRASLLPFIDSLPDRFGTIVGERGVRLSGGQRQRIGIARALYKSAAVLVLDEATSALDSATEAEVNAAIRGLDRKLTIVVISHRASSVAVCDRWLWIDDGAVEEIDRLTMVKQVGGGAG